MAICENDFWHSFDTSKNGKWQRDMLTDTKSDAFFRMCFMLGYYLQGLALVDVLSLKVEQVKQRKTTGESMYVIETCRRKTGKGVKIVIPESHTNRHRLFTLVYESAVNSKREHILPVMDSLGDDEHYIYIIRWLLFMSSHLCHALPSRSQCQHLGTGHSYGPQHRIYRHLHPRD